jgi:hypothetical protein
MYSSGTGLTGLCLGGFADAEALDSPKGSPDGLGDDLATNPATEAMDSAGWLAVLDVASPDTLPEGQQGFVDCGR